MLEKNNFLYKNKFVKNKCRLKKLLVSGVTELLIYRYLS